jgi:uncharacterized membrane protein
LTFCLADGALLSAPYDPQATLILKNSPQIITQHSLDTSATTGRRSIHIYIAAALLSLIGLADAIYLTVKHVTGGVVPCTLVGNCEQVLNSSYATIAGIPLAALGALAYFTVFSLATLASFGNELARSFLIFVVGSMLAFSIWLFILQAFVLHAFCQYCLLSAGVTLLLSVIVVLDRFYLRRKYADR